jgi:hypothetical protein
MQSTILSAASIIAEYNSALAKCFINEPFRRIDLAMAFARGFAKNATDDIHPAASLVLRVAYLDRENRAA